jgi:sugar/nucleoside kinase (ribokinase family)
MTTVTALRLAKKFSIKFFCNTKTAGLGEIFIQQKISCIRYYDVSILIWNDLNVLSQLENTMKSALDSQRNTIQYKH